MKRISFISIIISAALLFIPIIANAVVADPKPKTITQPDGSTLTITVHGDEFLNWITVGNRLVAKGADGYYYYATFNADGSKTISATRATNSATQFTTTAIKPPFQAVQTANMRRAQRRQIEQNSEISIGSKRFLVLLIEFSDLKFTVDNPTQAFHDLLNQEGYSLNGATGSSRDYYYENSNGMFDPTFDVYGPIKVSKGYAHYGSDDYYGYEATDYLLAEACRLYDSQIDFSEYDHDGDGYVDNVFFFYAGHNEAEGAGSDYIWPHAWAIYRENVILDGVQIFQFACTSEYKGYSGQTMASIGTFTHEFGHVLGLPDFYDTDYEANGSGLGLSQLSLMSNGSYNNNSCTPPYLNGIERQILGWMDEFTEWTSSGEKVLEPINSNNSYITVTTNPGEFFVYESRPAIGWDMYIGDEGLVIYHVDKSNNVVNGATAKSRWESGYDINSYAAHQCFDLVESIYPESAVTYVNDFFFPGRVNQTSFTANTEPAAKDWSGLPTGYNLTDIRLSGENVILNLSIDKGKKIIGTITNRHGEPIVNASITVSPVSQTTNNSIRQLGIVMKNSQESITIESDANGNYIADLTDFEENDFEIKVQALGYTPYTNYVEILAGELILDIVLLTTEEASSIELKKHNEIDGGIGSDSNSEWWAKVEYSANELVSYSDYEFKNISFTVLGQTAESVTVFIEKDNNRIYSANVPIDEINFGVSTTVFIEEEITIESGHSYSFGYGIIGCDYGFPLGIDGGPIVDGGGLYSVDGYSWYDLRDASINANFIISAGISKNVSNFELLGITTIVSHKESYNTGDNFVFELSSSSKTPSEVEWYFDNVIQNEKQVTLTEGEHIVKAYVIYTDGTIETLVLEILVQSNTQ